MQNYIMRYEGHDYMTLFDMDYMDKLVEDMDLLPNNLIEATLKTVDASAIVSDVSVSKDFNRETVVKAYITSGGKSYYLNTSNRIHPLSDIPVPAVPEKADMPIDDDSIDSVPDIPEPMTVQPPTPEPMKTKEEKPASVVEEKTEQVVAEEKPELVVEEKPEPPVADKPEPVVNRYNPVLMQRIDAYTLIPVDMSEVSLKGDTFCAMNGWKRIDDVYIIDDVVSVCRCVHSDSKSINITIPYSEVANYGKD